MRWYSITAKNGSKSKMIRTGIGVHASFPVLMVAVSLALAGCSMTFPAGQKADNKTLKLLEDDIQTGSIGMAGDMNKPASQFKNFTDEDWRRAKAALAVAVDPHGSPDRVLWDNPETQAKGSFTPEGQPFVKNDDICRNFKTVVTDQGQTRNLVGTACRPSGGEWDISEIKPAAPAKAAVPNAADTNNIATKAVKDGSKPAAKKVAVVSP